MHLLSSDNERWKLVFVDYGCCRFDNSIVGNNGNDHGYLTIDQCLEKCNKDMSCVAADVVTPLGDKYKCVTFNFEKSQGSQEIKNLRTECGKPKNSLCYARLQPKCKCIEKSNVFDS